MSKILFPQWGRMSVFGGPRDTGMTQTEGVALYSHGSPDPYGLFSTAAGRLGHDLNPQSLYCAMRWDYLQTPISVLKTCVVRVHQPVGDTYISLHPVDWGPNERTGRIIDMSPGAARLLGAETDARVLVLGLFDAQGRTIA